MTKLWSRLGIFGWILMGLGVLGLVGATVAAFAPGFQLAPSKSLGQTIMVELGAGDHAVYVSPSAAWSSVDCVGDADGEPLALRPDMTQQDVFVPERWNAQGSFELDQAGSVTISCSAPTSEARFTVGPVVSLLSIIGVALLVAVSLIPTVAGLVLAIVSSSTRARE